jgi:hypothetical protein
VARLPNDTIEMAPTLAHHYSVRGLVQSDPPEHTRMRRAVRSFFSAQAVSRLEDRISANARRLLESVPDDFDLVRDFAAPLPISMIADLIGVPEGEREGFPRWSAQMIQFSGSIRADPEIALHLDRSLVEFRGLLSRLFEERRADPRDDFLSLVTGLVGDGTLTSDEAMFMCVHLLNAGHETTTGLISNTVLHLLSRPEVQAEVVANLDLVPKLVDEVLRFDPPLQRSRRVSVADLDFHGYRILQGDFVVAVIGAAARDRGKFDDPDRFDIHRDERTAPHFAFGRGVHACLGSPLAKLEASTAIRELLLRFPDSRLPDGFKPAWAPLIAFHKLVRLPIETQAKVIPVRGH